MQVVSSQTTIAPDPSIDPASACPACVTLVGNKVTAVSAGGVRIDANQAGGTVSGNQYAAATQVQAVITVNTLSLPGGPGTGILTSQLTWLGAYPAGGDENEGTSAGDSFGINQRMARRPRPTPDKSRRARAR